MDVVRLYYISREEERGKLLLDRMKDNKRGYKMMQPIEFRAP